MSNYTPFVQDKNALLEDRMRRGVVLVERTNAGISKKKLSIKAGLDNMNYVREMAEILGDGYEWSEQ